MRDDDYNEFYGSSTDRSTVIASASIVVIAIVLLTGIAISFTGSVQF